MNFVDKKDEQILDFLRDGLVHKEVAKKMGMSPRSIESRILRMRARNHSRTTIQLMCKYVTEEKDRFFLRYREVVEGKTRSKANA